MDITTVFGTVILGSSPGGSAEFHMKQELKESDKLITELFDQNIFIKGEIVVRSGLTLPFYCNLKKAFGYPKLASKIAKEYSKLIPKSATCIAVMGFGGLPLGALISRETGLPVCYVRDEVKSHGTKSIVEGYLPSKADKILIIDDVYTTGNSLRKTQSILNSLGLKVKSALVFLTWNTPNEEFPVKSIFNGPKIIKNYDK